MSTYVQVRPELGPRHLEVLRAVRTIIKATGAAVQGHLQVAIEAHLGSAESAAVQARVLLNDLVLTGYLVKEKVGEDGWLPLFYPTKQGLDMLNASPEPTQAQQKES
jgi:hypothetical protein